MFKLYKKPSSTKPTKNLNIKHKPNEIVEISETTKQLNSCSKVVVIDTSGSVGCFLKVYKEIVFDYLKKWKDFFLITWDTNIHEIKLISSFNECKKYFDDIITGKGGTDITCVFKFLKDNKFNFSKELVIITDGEWIDEKYLIELNLNNYNFTIIGIENRNTNYFNEPGAIENNFTALKRKENAEKFNTLTYILTNDKTFNETKEYYTFHKNYKIILDKKYYWLKVPKDGYFVDCYIPSNFEDFKTWIVENKESDLLFTLSILLNTFNNVLHEKIKKSAEKITCETIDNNSKTMRELMISNANRKEKFISAKNQSVDQYMNISMLINLDNIPTVIASENKYQIEKYNLIFFPVTEDELKNRLHMRQFISKIYRIYNEECEAVFILSLMYLIYIEKNIDDQTDLNDYFNKIIKSFNNRNLYNVDDKEYIYEINKHRITPYIKDLSLIVSRISVIELLPLNDNFKNSNNIQKKKLVEEFINTENIDLIFKRQKIKINILEKIENYTCSILLTDILEGDGYYTSNHKEKKYNASCRIPLCLEAVNYITKTNEDYRNNCFLCKQPIYENYLMYTRKPNLKINTKNNLQIINFGKVNLSEEWFGIKSMIPKNIGFTDEQIISQIILIFPAYNELKEFCCLHGGSLISLLTGSKLNDFDFIASSLDDKKILKILEKYYKHVKHSFKFDNNVLTFNCYSDDELKDGINIDFITSDIDKNQYIQEECTDVRIINNQIIYTKQSKESIETGRFTLNTDTRVIRYLQKGFEVPSIKLSIDAFNSLKNHIETNSTYSLIKTLFSKLQSFEILNLQVNDNNSCSSDSFISDSFISDSFISYSNISESVDTRIEKLIKTIKEDINKIKTNEKTYAYRDSILLYFDKSEFILNNNLYTVRSETIIPHIINKSLYEEIEKILLVDDTCDNIINKLKLIDLKDLATDLANDDNYNKAYPKETISVPYIIKDK
jgi:hypothetical protein